MNFGIREKNGTALISSTWKIIRSEYNGPLFFIGCGTIFKMRDFYKFSRAALFAFIAVLTVCACSGGGGGSGGGSSGSTATPAVVASTKSFPIDIAMASLVKSGFDAQVSISGTYKPGGQSASYPVTGQGSASWMPSVNAYFLGAQALDAATVIRATETVNGTTVPVDSLTHQYFRSDNYFPVGQIDDSNKFYVVTAFSGWPTAARVGDTGALGTVTIYNDYTQAAVVGSQQWTYSIEADTADSIIFVWTVVEADSDGSRSTQADRYRVASSGAITFVSTTGSNTSGGDSLSLVATATTSRAPGTGSPVAPWAPVGTSGTAIGGAVAGLLSNDLVLTNGTNAVRLSPGATYFVLPGQVAEGATYNVVITSQPVGEVCSLANASGIKTRASVTNVVVSCRSTNTVTTFAGTGLAGAANGRGDSASFYNPRGLAVDSAGNVYVADQMNNLIRKITPAGIVSTFAGSGQQGGTNGAAAVASFHSPIGVAVDNAGNVYVADSGNHLIRKITPSGVVSTFAGSGVQGATNGAAASASFYGPFGVAVDVMGNLYVADGSSQMIRKVTPGGMVTTLAGNGQRGYADGPAGTAMFNNPNGIAVDASGNVYVADLDNNAVRKIAADGTVSSIGHQEDNSRYYFGGPTGVAVDASGYVYVVEMFNNRVVRIAPSGSVAVLAGNGVSTPSGSTNGPGAIATFLFPFGVAVSASGSLYLGDTGNHMIRKITFQ